MLFPLINTLTTVNHCSSASLENINILVDFFWVVAGPGNISPTESEMVNEGITQWPFPYTGFIRLWSNLSHLLFLFPCTECKDIVICRRRKAWKCRKSDTITRGDTIARPVQCPYYHHCLWYLRWMRLNITRSAWDIPALIMMRTGDGSRREIRSSDGWYDISARAWRERT